MTESLTDYTIPEIVRLLRRIEGKVDGIAAGYVPRTEFEEVKSSLGREIGEIKASQATAGYVPRTEFDQAKVSLASGIAEIKAAQAASRVPLWAVLPAGSGVVAVALTIVERYAQG